MQYVGRFVSSVYNTITPNINPATLSGAIDVIVVEREVEVEEEVADDDPQHATLSAGGKRTRKVKRTELASTPFHVRFGKMSVLRPGERKVSGGPVTSHTSRLATHSVDAIANRSRCTSTTPQSHYLLP